MLNSENNKFSFSQIRAFVVTIAMTVMPMITYALDRGSFNKNLQLTVNAAGNIVSSISIGMGVGVLLSALFKLKKYGEARTMMSHQLTIANPLIRMVCGAALLVLPTIVNTAVSSFWGADWLSHRNFNDSGIIISFYPAIMSFVHLLGVIAIIRAICMSTRLGMPQGQPGTQGKVFLHLLSGVLCLNIEGTLKIFNAIVGWNL